MSAFSFGQPVGGIVQFAYTVDDLDAGMAIFTKNLKVGPWFITGPFTTQNAQYRGKPTELNLTLAIGFAGHVMVELVKQHNTVPSVYQETIKTKGYGFHHWAIGSKDFDADVSRYAAAGYEVAFSDRGPRGNRVVYMDTTRDMPGMLEIIEMTDVLRERYDMMYRASQGWDGTDPVRR